MTDEQEDTAAFVDTPGRELLWVAAAVIGYGAPAVVGLGGFRVSPSYFVSRHGSIIIITLGEAIVEFGSGATDLHQAEVISALVLGAAIMVGVMLFAVGAHDAVAHTTAPLPLLPAVALAGDMALFYLSDVAYRWRDHHQVPIDRAATGFAAAAVLPVLMHLPASAALGVLTAMGWVRLGWELWRRPRIGPEVAG